MAQVYHRLKEFIEQGQACALATLVGVSGSSPQNVGAKVIFLPDGRIIGTIGGGCLEAEARRIALECLRKKMPRLFDLRLDDDFGWDDGLICGGRVNIFVNPFPDRSAAAFAAAIETAQRRERAALVTIIKGAEDRVGQTLLVGDGAVVGDALADLAGEIRESVAAAIANGRERSFDLSEETTIYVEPILPRPTLLIAGAGHVGAALAQVGALCDFEVVIVDDRPSFANAERLPFADRVVVDEIPRFVREFPINSDTYVVIVTRGHRHDAHVLRECIHSTAKYVGMIGSKRKICVIYEEMVREGLATPEELRRVHSPLGIDIASREVGEIAVSIAAELIAVRRGADLTAIRPLQYSPPFLKDELAVNGRE